MKIKKTEINIELKKIGNSFHFVSLTRQDFGIESVCVKKSKDNIFIVKRKTVLKYFKSLSQALNHMKNFLRFYEEKNPYK